MGRSFDHLMAAELPVENPSRREGRFYFGLFVICLLFNIWGSRVGWESRNLPGVEFRQAQTAISAYFIQRNHDFSLAYPTPVLGKPWSIPMEFPLYQWTVVAVSDLTGLELTKAGRAVSQACFYLALPAVFLLLGRKEVPTGWRWLVLAVLVTCPFYIFYSRAFLIETMALMFSWWFWVAFEESVEKRSGRWLMVAIIAGSGAGLVKVTTFLLYLVPTGWWAVRRLWSGRKNGQWRGDFIWMLLAIAVPFALTLWWLQVADAIKALNVSAQFLREGNMREWNWGTMAMRFSPQLWRQIGGIIMQQLSWGPVLAGTLALVCLTRKRLGDMVSLLICFIAAPMMFPMLYAQHEYYFVANGILLLMTVGLALVGLAEKGYSRWLVGLALLTVIAGQTWRYSEGYYEIQRGISYGGDGLTQSLRGLTGPEDVMVITGQDWNSMTPYYAERRALMIRPDVEQNLKQLDEAFAALKGETVGALVLGPATSLARGDLIRRAEALGIDRHPVYSWHDFTVYLRSENREEKISRFKKAGYDETIFIPPVNTNRERLADEWFELADLQPVQRDLFVGMNPKPTRFFSSYGAAIDWAEGQPNFGAHPVTRLVFSLTAGNHRLRTTVGMPPGSYEETQHPDRMTDGVEITFAALATDASRRTLYSRILNPRDNPEDRGRCELDIPFTLDRNGEVELFFGPGPAGRDTHDSISLGPLTIE